MTQARINRATQLTLLTLLLSCSLPMVAWTTPPDQATQQQQTRPVRQSSQHDVAVRRVRWQRLLEQLDRSESGTPEHDRLKRLVDDAAGQRHANVSRLFWHTSWAAAAAEARRDGKLVLSLRMLGRLTDELSCANSRFFRTALYPNQQIAATLREQFVLHWSSERPAPVVTVEFGDGRVMRRTVTGNSIHYLLNADGAVVDALPGMVSPQSFHAWLATHATSPQVDLRSLQNVSRIAWAQQLAAIGHPSKPTPATLAPTLPPAVLAIRNSGNLSQDRKVLRAPRAEAAVTLAAPKYRAEAPVVAELTIAGKRSAEVQDDALWKRLATQHVKQCRLDEASRDLIRSLEPNSVEAGERAFEAMIRQFEYSIAEDDLRNRFVMQPQVRKWILDGKNQLEDLNRRVYSELFLTPREDPYLGLVDAHVYTGLVRSGLWEASRTQQPQQPQQP